MNEAMRVRILGTFIHKSALAVCEARAAAGLPVSAAYQIGYFSLLIHIFRRANRMSESEADNVRSIYIDHLTKRLGMDVTDLFNRFENQFAVIDSYVDEPLLMSVSAIEAQIKSQSVLKDSSYIEKSNEITVAAFHAIMDSI